MDVKCDDRELVITASETFFEKYFKIIKEDIDKFFKDNKMKKLDFPNCIKIYNKTLASDIVSVSELIPSKKSLME